MTRRVLAATALALTVAGLAGCGGSDLSAADVRVCQDVSTSTELEALRSLSSTSYPSEIQAASVDASLALSRMIQDVESPDLAQAIADAQGAQTDLSLGAGSLGSSSLDTSEMTAALDALDSACTA